MAIQLADNKFYEDQVKNIINTKLEASNLLTVDTIAQGGDGMKIEIRKRTYSGEVEKLAKGEVSTKTGSVTLETTTYEVERYQEKFLYNDMDAMEDTKSIDVMFEGSAIVMANDIKSKYFNELAKISNTFQYTTFGYDTIVDSLAELNLEVEEGLFVIMGNDLRAKIRKDSDFIASKQGEILYTGQFGTICGVPVLYSKLVPTGTAYITSKDAVRHFIKRDVTIEESHDVDSKDNKVVLTRYGVLALVDDTKSIKLVKQQ